MGMWVVGSWNLGLASLFLRKPLYPKAPAVLSLRSGASWVYSHHHQVFQQGLEDLGDPWDPTNREFKTRLEEKHNARQLLWKLVTLRRGRETKRPSQNCQVDHGGRRGPLRLSTPEGEVLRRSSCHIGSLEEWPMGREGHLNFLWCSQCGKELAQSG